ncbi:MAG: glycosyltransferase family 2 protein [Bdellovibrionaceae bacterium]|nr:glycosyltransferase family 2 protein [Pseudobdellovibrionaceae bacterium]
MKKCAIVIPSFNEGLRVTKTILDLSQVLQEVSQEFRFELVVVDDCSSEPVNVTQQGIGFPIYILRHTINLGQGAALETGFAFCRKNLKPDYVATVDADGQHNAKDIIRFLRHLEKENLDILFATRFKKSPHIPWMRKVILKMASRFELFITGLNLSDAHNGFRVFNYKCLEQLKLTQNRMAHATEIKQIVASKKLNYAELENSITYSQESLQKGQSNLGALLILKDLLNSYLFDR